MLNGSELTLIDFGLCDRFITATGKHHSEKEEVQEFKGNLTFATPRQLQFKKSSRKDDLMSLGYMLVYMLNQQEMPFNFDQMFYSNRNESPID